MRQLGTARPWTIVEADPPPATVWPVPAAPAPRVQAAVRSQVAPGSRSRVIAGGALGLAALVGAAAMLAQPTGFPGLETLRTLAHAGPSKLVIAALIGLLVTAVHRPALQDGPLARAMAHAQILLCVSGALMMVIISDSLARAFGVAGAASIIRFRTPVEDPKDAVVLFLLMALGMASGLGAFSIAASGTLMLCAFLYALGHAAVEPPRSFIVELVANGGTFPLAHVLEVFSRHRVSVEPREVAGGELARAKYLAVCQREVTLEALNEDLMRGDALRAVAWEPAKKRSL